LDGQAKVEEVSFELEHKQSLLKELSVVKNSWLYTPNGGCLCFIDIALN
jgi:hypothetical protein